MSNIDAFANSFEPPLAEGIRVPEPDEPAGQTFPTDTGQHAPREEDELEAELGDDGSGAEAFEDEPDAFSGDAPSTRTEGAE